MLKKLLLLSGLLVTSMTAQAALISHFGYERDSASDVVKGGGLEWLKWDVTKGMSVDSALKAYASQGWRLASNDEMVLMFNRFEFGKTDWQGISDQPNEQEIIAPWNSDEDSVHNKFIQLFGITYSEGICVGPQKNCWSALDNQGGPAALFASPSASLYKYGAAYVYDDGIYEHADGSYFYAEHGAGLTVVESDHTSIGISGAGIALVRGSEPVSPAVPTPASIGLLALGLVALGVRRRHVLSR